MLPIDPRPYEDICNAFRWDIPEHYNIGIDVCDKWALREPGKLALIHVGADGSSRNYSFGEIKENSDRLANLLRSAGATIGDRIGILLPQAPETAMAHVAAYKIGAIAIPLFALFGAEALEYRLHISGAGVVVTNPAGTAMSVTLSNGAVINIEAGKTSGSVVVDTPANDSRLCA